MGNTWATLLLTDRSIIIIIIIIITDRWTPVRCRTAWRRARRRGRRPPARRGNSWWCSEVCVRFSPPHRRARYRLLRPRRASTVEEPPISIVRLPQASLCQPYHLIIIIIIIIIIFITMFFVFLTTFSLFMSLRLLFFFPFFPSNSRHFSTLIDTDSSPSFIIVFDLFSRPHFVLYVFVFFLPVLAR